MKKKFSVVKVQVKRRQTGSKASSNWKLNAVYLKWNL